MKIQPLANYLLIENVVESELTTPSGLLVVGGRDYRIGRVLAVGEGRLENGVVAPLPLVYPGDLVLYQPDRYDTFAVGSHFLISASELLAKVISEE